MRKRNWSEYHKQLVQRGSLTFLIDPKMIKLQMDIGFCDDLLSWFRRDR
ncbi:MAG: hypothetical protein ACSNEK_03260 [Parachlamydiaceae bacterium]